MPTCEITRFDRGSLMTNDPLAPLGMIKDMGGTARHRLRAELYTDLAERGKGFDWTTYFICEGDDLISDTGLSMKELLDRGVTTAADDAQYIGTSHGLHREQIRRDELDHITEWLDSGAPGQLLVCSLCPDADELDPEICRSMNFKPDRAMSSNVVYSYDGNRLRADYFSIEGHTVQSHQSMMNYLGHPQVGSSSLDILSERYLIPESVDMESIVEMFFGVQPRDFSSVDREMLAVAESIHRRFFDELGLSLDTGEVTRSLGSICSGLYIDAEGGELMDLDRARELSEVLRSQRLPAIVYGSKAVAASGISIETAARDAARVSSQTGEIYAGACPVSGFSMSLGFMHAEVRSAYERGREAAELIARWAGRGGCASCGRVADLYGCGVFCYGCNKAWCDEYSSTGRQLEPADIKRLR